MKWIQVEESPAEAHVSRCVEGEARCFSFMLNQHSSKLIPEAQWTFKMNSPRSGSKLEIWPVTKSPLLATPVPHLSHPIASTKATQGFSCGSTGKESVCNVGNLGLIPGLGRSHGRGHGNSLQYSCLENHHRQRSLEGATFQGVTESWTSLSD